MSTQTDNAQSGTQPSKSSRRWRWLAGIAGGFLAVALVYTAYWAQVLRYHQTTDDAYVGGNVVQITPQIPGTVVGIGADDTQFVKAGQALVRLDQADAKVALDQAEAQLARTVRDVRNLFATSAQLEAAVQQRQTDLAAAQSDLARRQRLGTSGAVSGEELQHAIDAVKASQAALLAAQQQLAANRARVDGTTLTDHPQVPPRRRAPADDRPRGWHDAHRSSAGARRRGGGAQRLPHPGAHRVAGAGRRLRGAAQRAARAARQSRHRADGGRAARSGVGGCKLQGAAARAHAGRSAGEAHRGPVRHAGALSRLGRRLRRRYRRGLLAPAGPECDRLLDQDRAARAGAHRARCARGGGAPAADRALHEGRRGRERRHGRGAPAAARARVRRLVDGCVRLEQCACTGADWLAAMIACTRASARALL